MPNEKLRRQILFEAARLMYSRQESEYYRAKLKAARRICKGWVKPSDLPSNQEIRDEINRFAFTWEGDSRFEKLQDMRVEALRYLRLLKAFRPKLIGSVLTGHVRKGSDIDIHVFSNSVEGIERILDQEGVVYDVEQKAIRKFNEERIYTHVHVQERFPVELTVYSKSQANYVFKSSITGKPIESATLPQFEEFAAQQYPELDLHPDSVDAESRVDRFQIFRAIMLPLDRVMQNREYHPEGDVLYHSLQVFELARDAVPWDEEFLLAALLHDVGKGIDKHDHVQAGLEALQESISERTYWLIENHMLAHQLHDGSIGVRARRRLMEHPDIEELELLGECDRGGRVAGAQVCELDEALDYIRDIAQQYG